MRHPPNKENGPAEVGDFDQAQDKPFDAGLIVTSVNYVTLCVNLKKANHPHYTPKSPKLQPVRVCAALDDLLSQAERRLTAAQNDDQWVTHWLIWLSLYCLKFSQDWQVSR